MSAPTPEEVEILLAAIWDQAWDFEMEEGNLFDDEPPEMEDTASPVAEEQDQGWRQSDFI